MPSVSDLSRAANILLKVQEHLTQKGQIQHDDDLQSMITLFENPIFRQMVKLQSSLETLNNEAKKENFDPNSVDFSTESGALLIGGEEVKVDNDLKVEDCNVSDFVKDTAHGRQIEEIDLFKYPNESLGFSVVGLRSEHRGDLGIFVQDIKPGGMACRDGRLKESDQILAINDHALSPNVSHQQAIAMLQKSKGLVKLIVARGGFPQSFVGSSRGGSCSSSASDLSSLSQETGVPEMNWSHVETIELTNTGAGLGFGIVGGKATGGVVVKTIVDGGAASVDGRLKSGDHITRIGDTDLTQMNSEQVAVVLRQCGTTVRLVVARTDDDGDEEFESESFTQQQDHGDDEFRPSVTTTNDRSSSSSSSTSSEELAKELFEVELVKDTKGLGITIHGFLSEDEDNEGETGVFVKSITSGSASDIDGRIRIGDQIIAVDGKRLDGENISSEEAVEILRSTGVVVRLTMARLQGNLDFNQQQFSNSRTDEDDDSDERENTEHENDEDDEDEDFSGIMSESEEANICRKWNDWLGGDYEIVVAQLRKFNYTSGLGISLEGTVDFSDTPHHYLRSILPEGPVGRNGRLQAGDELLEVNGNRLLGMNHVEVVVILKELPLAVRMVCARQRHHDDVIITRDITRDSVVFEEKDGDFLELKPPQQQPPLPQAPTRVESVTSPGTSSTSSSSEDTISAIKLPEMVPMEHYGVEEKVGVPMVRPSIDISSESSEHPSPDPYNQPTSADVGDAWHNDIIYIDLMKEASVGLGFSILELPGQEYEQTAIVVRSLLEGGIAEKDGRLAPGDRLLLVNQYDLSQSDLDHAVAILKSVPGGVVKIGVVKPRAQYRANDMEDEDDDDDDIPDVVQNYLPEEEEMRRRSSSSSSSSSLEVQSITPSPLLPPPSVHEAPILQQQGGNSRVEVKQMQISGMTAIALTTTSPTPMNDHHFTAPHIHPHEQPTSPSNQLPPVVPPKPQHYSAPSWQTATVNHPKPPMDGYERIVHMNKGSSSLGISVRPDKDGDGLLVVSITNGGAVDSVGEPRVADMIRRVNNDSAVGLGAMQARSLILNHSKFSTQITMCYIPGQYIDAFKRGIPFNEKVISPEKVMAHQSSNRRQHFAQIKSIFESADSASSDTNSHNSSSSITSPVLSTSMWGSYQRVEIMKHEHEELGLDIVGGSDEEMPQLSNGETLQGIFVRSIEAGGPLARDGRIKSGDKILKIGTFDLTNATHAEAIEAFSQQHSSRTTFIVQSFISRSIKKTAAASAAPPSGSEENEDDVILRKYEHIEGEKRVVRLVKGPNGLGISMAGSKEKKVFVVGVKPDGEAGRNGKIKVGDQLLEINNHPLDGANNNQVARQLISDCQSTLVMVICRQIKQQTDESSTTNDGEVKTIKLVKDFQGLGFSIQPCDEGICIKSIARDGTAERDGRLQARDLLLAVDDHPLVGVSCETATSILKQARGVVKLQVKTPTFSGDTSSSLPIGSRSSSGHLGSRSSDVDLLTCPIEAGCETTIEISKGKSGLGVSIVGGRDSLLNSILVHTVYEEGAAAKDGRLWPGDRILWVNEHDIRNAAHDEAIDILWKAAGRVRLVVIRDEHRSKRFLKWLRKYKVPFLKHWDTINNQTDEDIYNLHEVTLVKRKGLGLSIIGRRNHPGVYISDLIEGGVAQKEGTMKKGDHILKINGKDVKFASQETVASLLKNAREEVVITVGRSKSGVMPDDIIQPPHPSSLLPQQPDVVIPKEELALLSYTSKDREEHQIRFVEIHKVVPAQPLGVSIAGGMNSPLGDVPIFVAMVQQSGPAASHLNVGDIILSVNGRSTDGKTHDDVVQMLKGSDDMIVLMQVRDGGDEVHKLSEYLNDATSNVNEMISTWDPSMKDINQRSNNEAIDIELHRGNEGLGISIAGGYGSPHGNIPIFVKTVSKVGAAAEEGRLKKGDQIVSVNGEDLNGYTHEEAAEALRRKTNLIILRVIPS